MTSTIALYRPLILITILIAISLHLSCHVKNLNTPRERDHSENWAFAKFEKIDSLNPILLPSEDLLFECPITQNMMKWEQRNVLNPSAIVRKDKVYLFYRAQDMSGTSRIGMAISEDGFHFTKQARPVFYPDNDDMKSYEWNYKKFVENAPVEDCLTCYFDGVEDPRIIESDDGRYIMTYTAYDGKTARLSIASSTDLFHWKKHGLVLRDESYKDLWSKSGAIVVEMLNGRPIAKKINGKYWMYFGDTNLYLASSDNLLEWNICLDEEKKEMIAVLHPRKGYFDSRLVEPGPFALYTDAGIVLIYNGSNAANYNDPGLPKFTYAAGQALFNKNEPYTLVDRAEGYFLYPDKYYEKVGEVNEVCFVEGLIYFREQWYLYYGTADSKIAVAVAKGFQAEAQ